MKKKFGKIISALLLMTILLAAIPLSVSAGGFDGYADVSTSKLVDLINNYDYQSYKFESYGSAELDKETNTVKLLSDVGPAIDRDIASGIYGYSLWIANLTEDITFDLNGHCIYESDIFISDDDYNTITFKDSVGTGKIVGWGATSPAISFSGNINIVIESGTYIGGNAVETMNPNEPGTIWWLDCATNALNIGSSYNSFEDNVSIDIKGGTFIGGNGLNRQDIDEMFVENAAVAISIDSVKIREFKISENAVIKGGNGDNSKGGAGISICGSEVENTIEINGAQITGGSGTVGGDAIYSDVAVDLKITDAVLAGVESGGKEINVADGSNVEIINTGAAVNYTVQGVNVKADEGTFTKNAVITVSRLTQGNAFDKANLIFGEIAANYCVFDISAKVGEISVQPSKAVAVTFDIPESYNIDKTAVYYISADGKSEKLNATIDAEKRTVTVTLDHFSTYALIDESVAENTADGTQNNQNNEINKNTDTTKSPATGDISVVSFAILMASVLFGACLAFKKVK